REAVRLLELLDRRDRAGADLPVRGDAERLLHRRDLRRALALVAIQAGVVAEVPIFVVPLPLGPVPAEPTTVALDPVLDRAGMDVDRETTLVVRSRRAWDSDGDRARLPRPPRAPVLSGPVTVRVRPPRVPVVLHEQGMLLSGGAQGAVDREVRSRPRHHAQRHPVE